MELDRVLIDCIPEALTIEDLEKLISKTIQKAADIAIPKTKPKKNSFIVRSNFKQII